MTTTGPGRIGLYAALLAAFTMQALATSVSTKLESVAESVANCIEAFAKDHDGKAPTNWSELNAYVDLERVAINLGASLESQMLLVGGNHPKLAGSGEFELVAITSFPINEDRRKAIGRYIIYRRPDGRFFSRWEGEETIQAALSKVNTHVPSAAVFNEKPLKALYPEYALKLLEDAAKQGVPPDKAAEVIEKHVSDVTNQRAGQATSWAEIAPRGISTLEKKNQTSKPPPSTTSVETQSRSWLVWLAVVIVATGGAVWLFVRKSSE